VTQNDLTEEIKRGGNTLIWNNIEVTIAMPQKTEAGKLEVQFIDTDGDLIEMIVNLKDLKTKDRK
jgi:hypothetical protein